MDQFLAKPALIQRILAFNGCRSGLLLRGSRLGRWLRQRGMDMGLDHQALQKEGEQRQNRHPFSGRGRSGEGITLARHRPLSMGLVP